MTDCEYIKLCEEAFGATVPGCRNDHWRGCPNYDLCVLVHNQAIKKVEEKVKHRLKGLKQLMCTSGERVCPDYTHCHGGYDDERGERHITIIKFESFEKILNEIKALRKPASQEGE